PARRRRSRRRVRAEIASSGGPPTIGPRRLPGVAQRRRVRMRVMQALPARPGDSVEDLDTPTLIVDLDAFERNLDLMANAVRGAGIALRPHAKSHKCP